MLFQDIITIFFSIAITTITGSWPWSIPIVPSGWASGRTTVAGWSATGVWRTLDTDEGWSRRSVQQGGEWGLVEAEGRVQTMVLVQKGLWLGWINSMLEFAELWKLHVNQSIIVNSISPSWLLTCIISVFEFRIVQFVNGRFHVFSIGKFDNSITSVVVDIRVDDIPSLAEEILEILPTRGSW